MLSFKTHIAQVKILPKNYPVGYGLSFITKKVTKTAVIPVGYYDGFSRILSNKGQVLIHGKKITLLKEVQTHLPHLQTDRAKIKRILLNLLSNAAKFTEKGSIKVSVRQKEECLCFSVTDTGKGISQEHLFTVFQEFNNTSTHPESSGLGLAICKNFVTILGGTIDLESVPGNGTILTVKIPFIYQSKEEKLKEAA